MDGISVQEEQLMHRFYACSSSGDNPCFTLDAEDSFHAVRVLRLQPGDYAEVISEGKRYLSELEDVSPSAVILRALETLPSTEPGLSVTLFQGLPKGDKMDLIVQKAVELGAIRIVPVVFSRSIVHLSEKDAVKKVERWQKIAREAGKQSGRCIIPKIERVTSFSEVAGLFSDCEQVVVPWEECTDGGPLSFVNRFPSLSSLGIVIGPEGGISSNEMDHLLSARCTAITLGKRILRTETAGLAAISAFFSLYGEMEL